MILALVGTVLVSCTQSEFVGEKAVQQGENNAISFGGGTGKMTRADLTGPEAAAKLKNVMKVYGVKQNSDAATSYDKVFVDYSVKYDMTKQGNDDFNDGWYYVGAVTGQTIKYWDYASADYHFVAGSPVSAFTYALNTTTGDIESATVAGFGGRLNHSVTVPSTTEPVYIADPVVVAKANYNKEVLFSFKSSQAKVRVGIYENIEGYEITEIKFYNNDASPVASNYITLNSATTDYFQGCSTANGTITYDWTTTPASYTFAYDATGLTKGKFWEGGQFASGVQATKSTDAVAKLFGADDSMNDQGYFIVMPTPSATTAAALTIECDYTLKSTDGSNEIIKIKGAKATIPATYTKWDVNKAYTYLFKITSNTNGKTDPSQPDEGLYPIVFDAVVEAVEDGMVGTETTISTPSITVSQDGQNVVDAGIQYVAGDIVVTAMEGTTDVTSTATWSYVTLDGATFDYTQDFEKLGASGAATTWTTGILASIVAGKTYVIKAVTTNGTAYFVIEVPTT